MKLKTKYFGVILAITFVNYIGYCIYILSNQGRHVVVDNVEQKLHGATTVSVRYEPSGHVTNSTKTLNTRSLKTADLLSQMNLKTADLLNLLNLKIIDKKRADLLHQLALLDEDWVLSPPPCDKDTYLLILMVSDVKNFQRRVEVRESIKIKPHRGKKVRLAFVTGKAYEAHIDAKLRNESSAHNDVIQANYKEAYRNLTYKVLEVFKWTLIKCEHAKFMVKVDDDTVMVYQHIVDYVIGLDRTKNATMVYHGGTWTAFEPVRNPKSKWYISPEDFKNATYAPYASGFFVLFSIDVVRKMYHASFHVSRVYGTTRQTFPVEDAFIGILAKYAKIKLRILPYVIYNWPKVEKTLETDKCILVKLIAAHGFKKKRYSEIVQYYKQLENMTVTEVQTCEKKNVYPIN